MVEVFKRAFQHAGQHNIWTSNGVISGFGDAEQIELDSGEWAESEMVNVGNGTEVILIDGKYEATENGTLTIKYKDGNTEANCDLDTWHTYSGSFISTGYVRCRVEAP